MDESNIKEVKKNNKLLKILLPVLGVFLIVIGFIFLLNTGDKEQNNKPNLKDDYYDSINYGNMNLVFQKAQMEVYNNVSELGMSIENDTNYTDDDYFNFFDTFEDMDGRNNNGINELKPYFDEIDNANTMDEFSDILIKTNYDLGVSSFLSWDIMADLYDNSKNVIAFNPMILESIGLITFDPSTPSGFEFFTNEKYSTYKTVFEEMRIKLFQLYGYDLEKATNISNDISNFAKEIQNKSLSLDDLHSNYTKHYKSYTYSELKEITKNLPIDKLLNVYGFNTQNTFALFDVGHMEALDNYYTIDNLPLMKEILKLQILEQLVYLNSSIDYANVFADSYYKLLGEKVTGEELITYYEFFELKPKIMGSYLNVKYDEKYFTEIEKQEIIELINKIKDHYREVINNSNWLSESTKQEALKKLDNLKTNVGYVQKDDEYFNLGLKSSEDGGSIISNWIMLNKYYAGNKSNDINKKYSPYIDQFSVNAYYYPLDNSINFPSAFREIYRNITNKYEIYGYVGTIIAHEISHAFDNNGSKFDEYGNLKNWWTEEDEENFDKIKQQIIDYYSNYEIFGYKVNGATTVGENIADLGSIKTMISIMEKENASNEDYIKFFESFAKLWNDKVTKEQIEIQILSDNHAPNKIRVNGVLSSIDKFYEVYDIKENDKMYVFKEDRVGLW